MVVGQVEFMYSMLVGILNPKIGDKQKNKQRDTHKGTSVDRLRLETY